MRMNFWTFHCSASTATLLTDKEARAEYLGSPASFFLAASSAVPATRLKLKTQSVMTKQIPGKKRKRTARRKRSLGSIQPRNALAFA